MPLPVWRRTRVFRSRRGVPSAFIDVRTVGKNRNGRIWLIGALFALFLFGVLWKSRRLNAAGSASRQIAFDPGVDVPPPVRAILSKSCIDCHSEQTRWPWYAHIPPMSWLIDHDVSHARSAMNFSHLVSGPGGRAAAVGALSAICGMTQSQRMPPLRYRLMHPNSGLSAGDKAALCGWATKESSRLQQISENIARQQK